MKKKYKLLIAIGLGLTIIFLIGFLFLQNVTNKENSRCTIPNEFRGTWYQENKKWVIKKHSFPLYEDYALTPTSKPAPLDTYTKNGKQYFYKGEIESNEDGKYTWKKKGYSQPFWIAKMTVDGQKQQVMVAQDGYFLHVLTRHPTNEKYDTKFKAGDYKHDYSEKKPTDLDNSKYIQK